MFWQEVHKLDQLVTLKINSWNCPLSDAVMGFFSDKLVWIPMYMLIIAFIIWKMGWKKGMVVIAGALLTFAFCDQFSNLIKDLTHRLRPLKDEFMLANGLHVLEKGGGYGFFSAHAANTVGLATSTFFGLKETSRDAHIKAYGWWMFFWAFMVSISRIFVGKHYLGDVLAGMIIGAAAGYLFACLARFIIRKFIK